MIYETKDGDMIDSICFQIFGDIESVEVLLALNPGLAEYPAILPAGVQIKLPTENVNKPAKKEISVWD